MLSCSIPLIWFSAMAAILKLTLNTNSGTPVALYRGQGVYIDMLFDVIRQLKVTGTTGRGGPTSHCTEIAQVHTCSALNATAAPRSLLS